MTQSYAKAPAPSTNELSRGWFDDEPFGSDCEEYHPTEADYEEMASVQLENALQSVDISVKRRLRDQLDRLIADSERSSETNDSAPW